MNLIEIVCLQGWKQHRPSDHIPSRRMQCSLSIAYYTSRVSLAQPRIITDIIDTILLKGAQSSTRWKHRTTQMAAWNVVRNLDLCNALISQPLAHNAPGVTVVQTAFHSKWSTLHTTTRKDLFETSEIAPHRWRWFNAPGIGKSGGRGMAIMLRKR